MKQQTLLKAWAAFGIYWFVTLAVLTFSTAGFTPIVILAAISLYIGIILALISAGYLAYEGVKGSQKKSVRVEKGVKAEAPSE